LLTDRGWNTNGTLNYQNRIHAFFVLLNLNSSASAASPAPQNLRFWYLDTILFTDPQGTPLSGLDANINGPYKTFSGFGTDVPSVNYTGDGFGNAGPGGNRVVMDSEGLVLANDGSFWISDEYGPYIYHFGLNGKMLSAIRPPNAFIPLRNSSESFSADSPPVYDPTLDPIPADNPTGRDNNQGLEGLTISADGKTLSALMQSALNQEGGLKSKNRRYARMLQYDITTNPPTYLHEFVVPLPIRPDGSGKVAAQSEIHYLNDNQFLVLARDSNQGRCASDGTTSVYRNADIFDITNATDLHGNPAADAYTGSIATTKGNLNSTVTPATYCPFLDFNVNSELNKFGLFNGGSDNNATGLLNEKWESLITVPVNPLTGGSDGQFFLISLSDNDFITTNGYLDGGKYQYSDASGCNLPNQALVFQVTFPKGTQPY